MNLFSMLIRRRQARLALAPSAEMPMEPWERELWSAVHKAGAGEEPHLPWGVRHLEEALDDMGMDDGA